MARKLLLLAIAIGTIMLLAGLGGTAESPQIMVAKVDGIINPVSAEFLTNSINKANEVHAEVFVIELDTPGGLDTSMREIIKAMLASDVPVVVYVSPGGARAASAGTFITIASNIAAMAPQTNIGAAHPVSVGEKMDETMSEKVANDAAAYIKSLAKERGRNVQWAEEAVRKSVSITAEEALKKGVIDLVTANLDTLLKDIDGWKVTIGGNERTLHTKGASITWMEMGLRQKILDVVSNPNVAYILMMLGVYGLFFELTNPGAIFPGVAGGICLILAFYALQTLPVNYAGFLLILFGIILFILEVKIVSYGALTIGGIISMVLGSLMLFENAGPFLKLSLYTILPVVIVTALFFTVVLGLAWKAHRRKPSTGTEGMVGLEGHAASDINSREGSIKVHGEIWSAVSDEDILKGETVIVEAVEGLKLKVKKTGT